ncbi:MAG: RNA 2',3'-cyclic phosphodiesterase [Planctomycetes bacterium]|nr:RNA 2',3'-cyclic phosphodiesterase [Planctomycetota bacterium]
MIGVTRLVHGAGRLEKMALRIFVAIELSDGVRAAIATLVDRLKKRCAGVRWISATQWHLTVKFLGEVPDGDVDAVCAAVASVARASDPFGLQTHDCGCFPPRGGVRIVWAGVEDVGGRLLRCVEAVENEIDQLGFAREQRPFAAHVTVGRVKEDSSRGRIREAVKNDKLQTIEQEVTELVVMSSVLRPTGSEYSVVSRAKLGE